MVEYRKAQSIAEYALLLAIVAAVFTGAIQIYVRRGLQGRLRDASDYAIDYLNNKLQTDSPKQYEPYYSSGSTDTEGGSNTQQEFSIGGTYKEGFQETTNVIRVETVTGG